MRIWRRPGAEPGTPGTQTPATTSRKGRVAKLAQSPVLGLAVITPLVLAGAVGASNPANGTRAAVTTEVTPLAAVLAPPPDLTAGPAVVAIARTPEQYRFATTAVSAPPPTIVLTSIGSLRIPAMALDAYRTAEAIMARSNPGCGVSWNLLAGIGRIESAHASGGATDARGTAITPIYGPSLDGTLPGNEVIVQSVSSGRVTYARAMGPMQFLPGTWSRYASDGNADGNADPQNVYDASLAAARYLCSGSMNLRDQNQTVTAILRYNNSMAYTANVLGWAAAYATGVEPVNLPTIGGSAPPPISDAHLDTARRGLGPDLPAVEASGVDPLAGQHSDVANQLSVPPGPPQPGAPTPASARCAVFCLESSTMPAQAPMPPAPFAPPPPPPAPFNPFAPPPPPAPAPPPVLGPAPGPAPGPAAS